MEEKEALNLARKLIKQGEEVKMRIDGHGDWCVYTVTTKKIKLARETGGKNHVRNES